VLVGNTGVTTPALHVLLEAGVGLTLVTRAGRLRGRLCPTRSGNLPLRRQQYARLTDPDFCLQVSREIVRGKLTNCRTLALRILRGLRYKGDARRENLQRPLQRLEQNLQQAFQAESLGELRGLEGSAARAYFAILRAGLRWEGGPAFERRTRRPPKDPVNALLSLGYSLLTDALFSAAEIAGLDPYAGFYHCAEYGRPALALDLVEEFRPLVVDSLVLALVNKRMLRADDFEAGEDGGFYLAQRGLRVFFPAFVHRLNCEIIHPLAGRALSYQKIFELQARLLRKTVEGKDGRYAAFTTR
jgi:CRISPR-associated protein Cas1